LPDAAWLRASSFSALAAIISALGFSAGRFTTNAVRERRD